MSAYTNSLKELRHSPKVWLVTGVAGFIGSNLLEVLLANSQKVVGLDNFSTGTWQNLEEVLSRLPRAARSNFQLIEGDIQDWSACLEACKDAECVLHQAALGSVPRSMKNPLAFHATNVTGFLNMLLAARESGVRRFVYASSSSIYGDWKALPKVEHKTGRPLSPYAATKVIDELYADLLSRVFRLQTIGLRYFNVFGPRQNPSGPYAAVIPQWVTSMIRNQPAEIYGDGLTSRDFCYVENTVQANILAATTRNPSAINQTFNVALHSRTTLNELFDMIRRKLLPAYPHLKNYKPIHRPFRPGDIQHSYADISKAERLLGYEPTHTLEMGLDRSLGWFKKSHSIQERNSGVPGRVAKPIAEPACR